MNHPLRIIKLIFFLTYLYFNSSAQSQVSRIDSLANSIKRLNDDSIKVIALNEMASKIWDSQPDLAIKYGSEARDLGNAINYKRGVAYALKNIGLGYYQKGDYFEVLNNYWQQSLATFDSIGDKVGVSNILNNIGAVYANQGDDTNAIEYNLKSLKVAEEIGDKLRIASVYLNIGNVYLNKPETHDKSLHYLELALQLGEELNEYDAIGTASVNIGEIYFLQKNYDSALFYFEKSFKAYEINGKGNVPYTLNNIGKVYTQRNQYASAIFNHNKAYDIAKQTEDVVQEAQSLIGTGNAYRLSNRYNLAIKAYLEAEIRSKEVGLLKELKEIYEGLSITYSALKKYDEALTYQTRLTEINYDLYNADNDKKIERMQFAFDIEKKQGEIEDLTKEKKLQDLEIQQQKYVNYAAVIAGIVLFILAGGMFNRYRFIRRTNKIIEQEKERSENLLLNILPAETAEELKENGSAKARSYSNVTILFTDFKGFTELSATLSPPALVKEIHYCYMAFDEIMVRHGVEKIKTIGDAYMAAGGLPKPNDSHPIDVTLAAIEIREFMDKLIKQRKQVGKPFFEIRIGIHTGPVVAGVVGIHKFAYDIWGDAVNIASRMESNSQPGKINVSAVTYELIKDQFQCTPRGKIAVKGAGEKTMYFVESALEAQPA